MEAVAVVTVVAPEVARGRAYHQEPLLAVEQREKSAAHRDTAHGRRNMGSPAISVIERAITRTNNGAFRRVSLSCHSTSDGPFTCIGNRPTMVKISIFSNFRSGRGGAVLSW